MNNYINGINYISDNFGCGYYRMKFVSAVLQTMKSSHIFAVSDLIPVISDPKYYVENKILMIRCQRWHNLYHYQRWCNVLKPTCDVNGFWLTYDIDDVLCYEDIPSWNHARQSLIEKEHTKHIYDMMKSSDLITVSTEPLKNYYQSKFGLHNDKFTIIPNYIPKFWIDGYYDLEKIQNNYSKNIKKPRIGFVCSITHFDVDEVAGQDDFTNIIPWVVDNVDKYQFVFFGGCPPQLKPLIKQQRIEFYSGCDILSYPQVLSDLNLNLVIMPLQDNIFNRCKSNIKLLEFWSLGIPIITSDIITYNKYTDFTFNDLDQLDNSCNYLFNKDKGKSNYLDLVKHNRDIICNGDSNSKNGWWLENNIQTYYELYNISNKTIDIKI